MLIVDIDQISYCYTNNKKWHGVPILRRSTEKLPILAALLAHYSSA